MVVRKVDPDAAERLARAMVNSLPRNLRDRLESMDKERMGKKMKQDLFSTMVLGAMESEDFLMALAADALAKPMEFAKLQTALVPKNVTVEENVKVQHTIVVPAMQTVAEWMAARGEVGGPVLDELGFEHVTVEEEDDD